MKKSAPKKPRKTRRRLSKLALLLLFMLWGAPWAWRRGVAWVETAASEALGMEVRMEGARPHWPLALGFDALEGRSEGETLLEVRAFYARVSLRQLFQGKLWIHNLEVEEFTFNGLPPPDEPPPPRDPADPLDIPDLEPLFERLVARNLQVQRVRLGPPFLEEPVTFSLKGSFGDRVLKAECRLLEPRQATGNPTARLHAELDPWQRNLRAGRARLDAREWTAHFPGWPGDLDDLISLGFSWEETRRRKLTLTELSFDSALVTASGAGEVRLAPPGIQLKIEANLPSLRSLEAWTPELPEGGMTLSVALEGPLSDPALRLDAQTVGWKREGEPVDFQGTLDGTLAEIANQGSLSLRGNVADQPLEASLRYLRDPQTLRFEPLAFKAPGADMEGSLHIALSPIALEGALSLSVEDSTALSMLTGVAADFKANASLRFLHDAAGQRVEVSSLSLHVADRDIVAETPLRLALRETQLQVEPWTLRVGRGRLRLQGSADPEALDLQAEVLDLPLSMFGFAREMHPDAEMEGTLRVEGNPANPVASLQVDFSGLRPLDPELWDGPPAQFGLRANLQDRRLSTAFRLEGLPGDPVTLDLNLPLPLSLYPFSLDWPPSGEISGHLRAATDLEGLARLFVLDVYHRARGTLEIDVRAEGTTENPELSGSVTLLGGRYEHELSGTLLRDIELVVSANRDTFSLDRFVALDGRGGTAYASGSLRFNREEQYPFQAKASLENFRLMRNDQAEATGRGSLEWNGTLAASKVQGRVNLSPVEIRIPERALVRVPNLDVIEVFPNGVRNQETENDTHTRDRPRHRVKFDVDLHAPERVFVRGRGLDSEWSARVHLGGATPVPELRGTLQVIRGRFLFFGRRLVITRGLVSLDGGHPPMPLLDVAAELSAGGILATLRVRGPAEDPDIELESSPPLPEDEILARMLFGREATRVTPWQALTLAQAVNRLRGGGGAFDLMGETRRMLRVDQIDIRTADEQEGDTAVAVGKYVSDRVYVELERGFAAEGGRATVEVELTPRLRLQTEAGANADTGIGLIWGWDY